MNAIHRYDFDYLKFKHHGLHFSPSFIPSSCLSSSQFYSRHTPSQPILDSFVSIVLVYLRMVIANKKRSQISSRDPILYMEHAPFPVKPLSVHNVTPYSAFQSHSHPPASTLQWRHHDRDGVSNHQPHDCLLNRLFRPTWKKTSKLHVTGLCEGNLPGTGEFPTQRVSNAENVSIWWRHHAISCFPLCKVCVLSLPHPLLLVVSISIQHSHSVSFHLHFRSC